MIVIPVPGLRAMYTLFSFLVIVPPRMWKIRGTPLWDVWINGHEYIHTVQERNFLYSIIYGIRWYFSKSYRQRKELEAYRFMINYSIIVYGELLDDARRGIIADLHKFYRFFSEEEAAAWVEKYESMYLRLHGHHDD